jgi:hypothetical protein
MASCTVLFKKGYLLVGGTVVITGSAVIFVQFRDDFLCQSLSQFHAPLVERIDIPDDTLGEYFDFAHIN